MTRAAAATYYNRMKRLVLPAIALVLLLTACGAAAKRVPQAAEGSGRVPAAVRVIAVHAPTWSRRVTSLGKVAQIVRWFDGLAGLPHRGVACPLVLRPEITISFRSAEGRRLAYARVPTPVAGVCDPIRFRSGGKTLRPLIEAAPGESLARQLKLLLVR